MRGSLFFSLVVAWLFVCGVSTYAQEPPAPVPSVTGPFWLPYTDPDCAPNVDSDGVKRVFGKSRQEPSRVYYKVTYTGFDASMGNSSFAITLAAADITITTNGASARIVDIVDDPVQPNPNTDWATVKDVVLEVWADPGKEGTVDLTAIAEGTATDGTLTAGAYEVGDPSPTVFVVDHLRPSASISIPDWERSLGSRFEFPLPGLDPERVEFIVDFSEDVLISSFTDDDVIPRDVAGLWENDPNHEARNSIFSAQFAEEYCYSRNNTVVAMADPGALFARRFLVTIHPRRDCTVSIKIADNAVEDLAGNPCPDPATGEYNPVGNMSTESPESEGIVVNDAPRVYVRLQPPYTVDSDGNYHTNSPTIVWNLRFSEPVTGFGTGDVKVNDIVSDPDAAGGTKTVVVTGTQNPGEGGAAYNVGVSGMTYSGKVKIFLTGGESCRQPPQEWFHHPSYWCQPNWPTDGACDTAMVYWDGTPPDRLAVALPVGLPQPPNYTGTYETDRPMVDIGGTAHDDVGISSVSWQNNRGGSGYCNMSNLMVHIVGPSASSTVAGPVTYKVYYLNAANITLAASDIVLNKTGTANGTVSVTGTDPAFRTVTISDITGSGTLGISIIGGTAADENGFLALPAGPSATFSVGAAGTSISISEPSEWLSTGGKAITYTVTYSGADNVTLAPANITLNKAGSADGTVWVSGTDNTTRTVTISGITGSGTLGISIAAGTASGAAGPAPAAGPSATFDVGTATVSWRKHGLLLKPGENVVTIAASDATSAALSYRLTIACNNSFLGDVVDPGGPWPEWLREACKVPKVGQYTSIAVDSSGNPRISYYDASENPDPLLCPDAYTVKRDLKYAAWDGQKWNIQTVDGNLRGSEDSVVGQYSSLKLDSSGNPHISYYDATNTDLKYAYFSNGQWYRTIVDGNASLNDDRGQFSSLALDSSGRPRIAYYDASAARLMYAAWSGTAWIKSVVDSGADVGKYASLALDSSGLPRIAYYDATNRDLKYAAGSDPISPTWTISVADSTGDVGQYASLALNSSGLPRIAYYEYVDAAHGILRYIEGDDAVNPVWSVPQVVDNTGIAGQFASLKLHGLNDQPRIAYYDAVGADLKYAEGDSASGPSWTISVLDDGRAEANVNTYDVGQYCSLVLDAAGSPHVSYYDATNGVLKYRCRALGPRCTVTAPAGPTNASPLHFIITFSSPVTGLELSEVEVTGATRDSLVQIAPDDGTTYRLAVTPLGDGTITCRVPSGVARAGGVDNLESNTASVIYDGTRPTVIIDQDDIQWDPTDSSPIYFTVVFSEPVADFSGQDVTISGSAGGVKSVHVSGYGSYYLIAVTGMTTAGKVIASIDADKAHDAAGNGNLKSTSTDNTVWYDGTRPTVTINQAAGQRDPTNENTINFTVVFSESTTNAYCYGFRGYDGIWTAAPDPRACNRNIDSVLVFQGDAKFRDNDGKDTRRAEITPIGPPDQFGHYRMFNVAISGMTKKGTVKISVPAYAAYDCDESGQPINGCMASTSDDNSVTWDATAPTATINRKAGQPVLTKDQPIRYTVEFSKPVTGFDGSDVQLTGTADFTKATRVVTGTGTTYTVEVSGVALPAGQTAPVSVIADVPQGVAFDEAGNGNLRATSQDSGNVVWFDNRGALVTVEQAPGQPDSTLSQQINFAATFSEPVTGFTSADVEVTGTAFDPGATPIASVTGSGTKYTVTVSGMTGAGSVMAAVRAGAAQDELGNLSAASTSTDNKVVYFPEQCTGSYVPIPDNDPNGAESTIDLTGISGVITDLNVKLSISHGYDQDLKAYVIGPDGTQVELFANVGGNGANFIDTVLDDEAVKPMPSTGAPYTGSFKPLGVLAKYDGKNINGVWRLKVVDDHAEVTGTLLSWCLQFTVVDTAPPTCTITGPSSPTNLSPINFNITFSEPVFGLTGDEILVSGGTKGTVSGSGANYVMPVTPPADGTVTCTVPARAAYDMCGNYNASPASLSVVFSGTPPTVTINQAASQADPTATSPIVFTVVFSEIVTGFATGDVQVTGTAFGPGAAPVAAVAGSGANYTVRVSGMNRSGTVVATVPAGVCVDSNNNPNLASTSTDNTVTYDITRPTVTVNQAAGQPDPTMSSPINFTAVFSKPVTGFTGSDVVVGGTAGGTKTVTVTGSGTTYNIAVALSAGASAGSVKVSIPAGVAQDALGNLNEASTSTDNTVWYDDGQPPWVTVNQAEGQADPTNSTTINFTVEFNKEVAGFTADDVEVVGDPINPGDPPDTLTVEVTPSDGQKYSTYNVAVSGMTVSQVVTVTVPAGVVQDDFGLGNTASTSTDNQVTFDNDAPSVRVEQAAGQADPTPNSPIYFTATFSEPVIGFASDDVAVTGTAFGPGATATVVVEQTGPATYSIAVGGMTVTGKVIVTIPAGGAQDAAGNGNLQSTSLDNSVTFDTPPTVTVNQAAEQADPTSGESPIVFDVIFSEPVIGFTGSDVVVSGTAGGSKTVAVRGSGASYKVSVSLSGSVTSGTVIATIPAGVAYDSAGNPNLASTSTDNVVTVDNVRPTVTVDQASGQADPTNASPILFTIIFSKPVTDFTAEDVTITGTAGGTKSVSLSGSGTAYTASVSGMTTSGTVIASVAAGKAHDASGNANLPSTSTDNTVTYDIDSPSVTINQAAGQADPTSGASPIVFDAVFSEPVVGFTGSDVAVSGTAGGTKTVTVTGSGASYKVSVSLSGSVTPGTVIATIPAGVATDLGGNPNQASTSTDNTVTIDNERPTVTVNQAAGQADPTRNSPINFTVVFSKPVTGFTAGDVTIGGTSGATTAAVTGSGKTYNVAVSGMQTTGTVVVSIAANVAFDSAGNGNEASTSTDNSVLFDNSPPSVTITFPTTEEACTRNTTSLSLRGSAEDDVAIAKVEWAAASGGRGTCTGTTSWSVTGLSIAGGEDTITVTATDTAGNSSTDSLTVQVIDASPGAAWTGLAMVSLPIIPDETDPKIVVGFRENYWVVWKPDTRTYVRYPGTDTWFNPPSKTPGRGFWAAFDTGGGALPRGVVPAQDEPVAIRLAAGWNLIGQPFIAPLTWDLTAIKVKYGSETRTLAEARDAGWIKEYAWGWKPDTASSVGGAYYLVCDPAVIPGATPIMEPWCAYWLKANVGCDLILPAP